MRQPRYKAIVDELASAIRDGSLSAGTRLPTHRQLARYRGIALATATRVYSDLREAGLVVGEPGRGTFVRQRSEYEGMLAKRPPRSARIADLSFNQPVSPGQGELLREALRELSSVGDITALLDQHPPGGRRPDRALVSTHLLDRGIDVAPDQVLIAAGGQHALDTAVRTVTRPGDVLVVDELTYPGIKLIAERHRIELAPVPHGPRGTNLDDLERTLAHRRVAAIYVMPTLHNPLGTVMSDDDRARLALFARGHDAVLIEDGTYAFLAPDAPPPLQNHALDRTIYVGGLSKVVGAGLRFGYLAFPSAYRHALSTTLRSTTWGSASIVTALVMSWLRDGRVPALEAQRRDDARARQEVALGVLAGLPYEAHTGSYFGWLPLPHGTHDGQIAEALAEAGVVVTTADAFRIHSGTAPGLRIALATPPTVRVLERGLETLRDVVSAGMLWSMRR